MFETKPGNEAIRFVSEHAHPASAIEWWFFHGWYEGPLSGRRYFMATLFRSNLKMYEGGQENGFILLLSVLDPERGSKPHESLTWVDKPAFRKMLEQLKSGEPHVDPVVQRAYIREIEDYGPPSPILLKNALEIFEEKPLHVEWDDFSLSEREGFITMTFCEPDSGRLATLHLAAAVPCMDVQCGSEMAYRCYPRIRLQGSLGGGEKIVGEAWMDHQWGNLDLFHNPRQGAVLGWEWFGINFDDGCDLLLGRHRNAQSGEIVGTHVTCRTWDGNILTTDELTLTPLRYWSSQGTFIDYPVAWKIEIPGLDGVLVFQPLNDNQEIAALGTMRAVWEGVGTVSGTLFGAEARGTARGEFHGYGYVFRHQDFVKSMGRRVDKHLEEFFPRQFDADRVEQLVGPAHWEHEVSVYTEMLSKPVWDLIDRSGKRWRPIFGILLLEALGVSSLPYEGLICSMLEFIHAGALIIDDIEDDSLLRRGQECIHLRYGLDVALNAGNTLYFLPGLAVISHPLLSPEKQKRWLEIKERICIEAHSGQATDIFWSRRLTFETLQQLLASDMEAKILQMYALKTASAAKGAADFVATIADAGPELTAACVDFARMLGVAYQIVDDIHNFSRSADWTKVCGEDLINGKPTFVLIKAIRQLDQPASTRLQTILCTPELRKQPETINEGIELVYRSGALDLCRATAKSMVDEAWNAFSPCVPSSGPKIMLYTMCLKLIELAYDA